MSRVFFISDLHFYHKNIFKFRDVEGWILNGKQVSTVEEHNEYLVQQWNSVVGKRDTVYVLGDVCFDATGFEIFARMKGNKNLIMGNHDKFDMQVYLKYFASVKAFRRYKGYWLSHCPMHPQELRGRKNIHGHLHSGVVMEEYVDCYNDDYGRRVDSRYINVAVEHCANAAPVLFTDIVKRAERE